MTEENNSIRLQKYLSDCGVVSRRRAEEEIKNGNVTVNGSPASLGDKINPGTDKVCFCGKPVAKRTKRYTYLMLNKPRGVLSTAHDEKQRTTVVDLVKAVGTRVYPVGRLDCDSDGLLLLTDDGQLTNLLTHPSHHIEKEYRVVFSSVLSEDQQKRLLSPMTLDGYALQPIRLEKENDVTFRFFLKEGRNRQIRRMCEQVGAEITQLTRLRVGPIQLNIPTGAYRHLSKEEIQQLKEALRFA